mmetsp:Transcript_37335/g.94681  ORF Transcript_37335/g.94681 Transcript_37335/m.94681 type:complete len:405 (-) Transcript_37335:816-2030(-)
MRSVASHDSSSFSILSLSVILEVSCSSSAAPAVSPSRSSRSLRSASRSSSISRSSSSLSGVSSSMNAAAPRGTVAQSTSSIGGSDCISLVRVRPLATPAPKTPSDSASKAPTLRAQRSLEGDMTTSAGRSISLSSKCAAKPTWHVASIHEKLSGPPALRLRSAVSISRCASLLPFSGAPSSSATAHSPPALTHASSKVAAESSGSGPSSFLGAACCCCALGGSFGLPPAAPISCSFISTNWPAKLARLPKLNLPCICGVNAMPAMAALPSSLCCDMSGYRMSTVGTFWMLKLVMRFLSLDVAMPKPSLPSNAIESERKSGGTDGLSEKSRQIALVSAALSAAPIHWSMLAEVSFSTRLSGSVSSTAFFAAATPASSPPKALAFFAALAPVPYGSTATPGRALTP